MEAAAQRFLQNIKGLLPGAVPGVKGSSFTLVQFPGDALHQLPGLALRQRGVIEVEAREHRVGGASQQLLSPSEDVHNTVVGAAAEERRFALFRHQQALLMAEGVLWVLLPHPLAQGVVGVGPAVPAHAAGKEGQLFVDDRDSLRKPESGLVFVQRPVEADVGAFLRRHHIVFTPCLPLEVNGGVVVALAEQLQPAAVVVMGVGEERHVHRLDVHAQPFGVFQKHGVGPHVEKDAVPLGLNVHGQPMGLLDPGAAGVVFQQQRNFHGLSLQNSATICNNLSK